MKLMRRLLGGFLIVVVLFAQSGCAMIAGHVAVAAGKTVYHKIEDDKANKDNAG